MACACVLSVALAACGGKSEHAATSPIGAGAAGTTSTADAGAADATSAPVSVPLGELCSRYENALCQHLVACGLEGFRDIASCTPVTECTGAALVINDVTSLNTLAYDASSAGACLDAFAHSACPANGTPDPDAIPDAYRLLASCPGAVTALSGLGQVCTGNAECTSGLFCKKGSDPSCQGTCGPPAVLSESCVDVPCADGLACDFTATCVPAQRVGDACNIACNYVPGGGTWSLACPSDQICPGDLWCDPASAQCANGRGLGDPCGQFNGDAGAFDAPCAVNLWCSRALNAPSGVCVRPGAEGAPCDDEASACEAGLHCANYVPFSGAVPTLGTCIGISGAGSSCGQDADCLGGLLCILGHCSNRVGTGGACFRDVDCVTGLVCQTQRCEPLLLPGAACSPRTPCRFARCVSGICEAYPKYGESCASGSDCTSGQCVQGSCSDRSICSEP
jgi:hypothetical protein